MSGAWSTWNKQAWALEHGDGSVLSGWAVASHGMSEKQIIGWKLYYGDRSVADSRQTSWQDAPSENVQILLVFFQETYRIHREDGWHEENYRDLYCGKDYFWQFGNGQANDVPPDASVKLGFEISDSEWLSIYNKAWQDVSW